MGLSSSKTTSKSTSTVAPSTYSQPYIDSAAATFKPGYDAAMSNNMALLPRVNAGLDYSGHVLNGDYLGGNPHLQGVIDKANADTTTGVNSRFEGAGRYGSGNYAGVLAKALLDNENQIRYQDYNTERGYQNAAPGQIAGLTGVASGLPQAAGSTYADQIAHLLGQYNTSTGSGTQKTSNNIGQMLMAAAAAAAQAAAAGSDRRLKREIVKIGELIEDGLGVYIWRYIWGAPMVGVMADEVAEKRPWALGPVLHGFATVRYGAL